MKLLSIEPRTSPSSRVQLVNLGELLHPGSCMICGSGICELGYVRLGVYYDYEGEMYLCMNCVEEIVTVIGGLTRSETMDLQEIFNKTTNKANRATELLRIANERLNHVDSLIGTLGDSYGPLDLDDNASEDTTEAIDGLDSDDDEPVSDATTGEPEPEEPVEVKRPNDTKRLKLSNPASIEF